MSTVVQAVSIEALVQFDWASQLTNFLEAEGFVVASGTAVVTQVLQSTTGNLHTIEDSAVKEAVSATHEHLPSSTGKVEDSAVKEAVSATHEHLPSSTGKVEDGLANVATEVAKCAESSAVETVEQHPELIAEGALAVVIGAASLVLPELVPGEVALIGKMAADSAKKTVTTIVSNTGSKVMKDISKDLADDVKERQTKDIAAAPKKENPEGPKDANTGIPAASNPKAATVETVIDGSKGSISSPPVTQATPDSNSATLEAANFDPNGSTSSPSDTESTPAGDTAPKDKTVVIGLAQEPSKVTSNGDGSSLELNPDSVGAAPQTTSPISKPAPVSEHKTETTNHGLLQATDNISSSSPPTIVAAVAQVTNTSKTMPETTPQEVTTTTEGSRMVTVSQESLDLLHQKIDKMNEAIQQITKALAFHMPTPPPRAVESNAIENAEAIINEALATAVKPLTDLIPEIMAQSDDSTHPLSEDPSAPKSRPTRPNPQKRASVISSIGKVLWPFGVPEKVATVTVTEVSSDRIEVGV